MLDHLYAFWFTIVGPDAIGSDATLPQIAVRGMLVYLIGVIVVRFGKSRLISHTSPLDVIVAFILGSLLSRGITGSASLSATFVASAAIVASHWVLTWATMDSPRLGRLWKGSAVKVIENGKPIYSALAKSHISERDIAELLRLNVHTDDMTRVKVAYKERNGDLGVVLRERDPQVVGVNVAAGVQTVRIELADG